MRDDATDHLPLEARRLRELGITVVAVRLDANTTTTTTTDMTPWAAHAAVESARLTHAVPAQEETARARQETIRLAIVAGAVIMLGILIAIRPEVGFSLVGLAGVLGAAWRFARRAQQNRALPPKADDG